MVWQESKIGDAPTELDVIVGELHEQVVWVAKALSSTWSRSGDAAGGVSE